MSYTHKTYPIACVRLDAGMYTREELLAAIEEMDIRNAKAIAAMKKTKEWVGLTQTQVKLLREGVHEESIKTGDSIDWVFYTHLNEALKEKNT